MYKTYTLDDGPFEFLNRIELKGVVGRTSTTEIGDRTVTRFSVMTQYVLRNPDGTETVEVTWFYCSTFDSVALDKGDRVHVIGRFKSVRYINEQGEERTAYEVVANSITKYY